MSKLMGLVGAALGLFVFTSPCVAQNAPWPPPAGMSAGEYLQRYGRLYNPYTGGDPRRVDPELYRALPQPPRESAPLASATGGNPAGSNPSADLSPTYDPYTGKYEVPCPAGARSTPSASLGRVYNPYTGKSEVPCSRRR
jgi:hypothetical protein